MSNANRCGQPATDSTCASGPRTSAMHSQHAFLSDALTARGVRSKHRPTAGAAFPLEPKRLRTAHIRVHILSLPCARGPCRMRPPGPTCFIRPSLRAEGRPSSRCACSHCASPGGHCGRISRTHAPRRHMLLACSPATRAKALGGAWRFTKRSSSSAVGRGALGCLAASLLEKKRRPTSGRLKMQPDRSQRVAAMSVEGDGGWRGMDGWHAGVGRWVWARHISPKPEGGAHIWPPQSWHHGIRQRQLHRVSPPTDLCPIPGLPARSCFLAPPDNAD